MLRKLDDFKFDGITESTLRVDDVLASHFPYEQGLVKYVVGGRSMDAHSPWDAVQHEDCVFKVEGYDKLNLKLFDECRYLADHFKHIGPVTCHLFKSPLGATSFPAHTDPDDVVLLMVSGAKQFETDDGVITLNEGEILFIPAGSKHRAINTESSLMLSFGLERFLVEKL
jgi:mannose-6-phosphate isomerase-like protein (cupin superfamily)